MRESWKTWVLAARPKTLTAALVPVGVATALVHSLGYPPQWRLAAIALATALCLQIGTNFFNDALDFLRGADTADRLGPTRAVQSGKITARAMLEAGYGCFALAAAGSVPLVARGGLPILGLTALSLGCGYAYTGGPYPLAYRGLGDVFVILFFGLAAVVGMGFLHTLACPAPLWIAGLQIGSLAAVLIAINNLRDIDGDRRAGKRTLAVRLGQGGARVQIALLALFPFVLGLYWAQNGRRLAGLLPCALLPLALRVVRAVARHEPGPIFNRFLAMAAALHLGFGVLLALGLWWE